MASDLAAIRAEGRRLLADFYAFGTEDDGFRRDRLIDFFYDHADALLAPTLTEEERRDVEELRRDAEVYDDDGLAALVAIFDKYFPPRLSGSTSTGGPT